MKSSTPLRRAKARTRPNLGIRGHRRAIRFAGGSSAQEIRIRRILVPIDFTRASIKPLSYAAAIARLHGARIVLLHVTRPISVCVDCGYGPVARHGTDERQAQKDRIRLRRAASRHLPRHLIEDVQIRNGDALDEILGTAKEMEVDLIVLHTHKGTEPKTLGTHETAERVVRHAPCPVLVVYSEQNEFLQSAKNEAPRVCRRKGICRRNTAANPSGPQ